MAAQEGLRRVRVVGRWVLITGLCFDAVVAVLFLLAVFRVVGGSPAFLGFGVAGVYLSIAGGAIQLVAWILEGFFAAGGLQGE